MSRPSHRGRDIDGILLLDKPIGLSSNYLLKTIKWLFRAKKAGYTGTLDPLATGMLPICLGEATKFSQYLLDADKRYRVTTRLGERTDTSDAEGKIVSVRPVVLDKARLVMSLEAFRGAFFQVPSMFSALKYQGRPLYEYARQGIEIAREARPIEIYSLQLLHWNLTQLVLEIHCSKGTYIRTIIDDLGERLGCGAHVQVLRRLTVARYSTARMITLDALLAIDTNMPETQVQLDALLLSIDSAVADMPAVHLPPDIAARVQLGQKVAITTPLEAGLVRLTEGQFRHFLGIGEITIPGFLTPLRLIAKP
ncbi:tRNA pseudouridine(55) synthase TruB [Candidatus Hoaglandella endobia]|uniref:tRNA pseudouridine synthase B n=1 Tax=Candidatus Hoaglandella endobia TaxID=1778263 RepID=A0A143WTJ7_9ENTR|nr:tRNA pseudouridine(55) synthase TruB [Candidatus Hoaglandella endobia]CUX97038.1 tRNA pseudouridine synthase B [Candidatus Hoaglandella endobia]